MGITLAQKFGASLTVLSVIPELHFAEADDETGHQRLLDGALTETTRAIKQALDDIGDNQHINEPIVRHGQPAEIIAEVADEIEADLCIVGSHCRRGARRLLLGSISSKVAELAPCPVLIAK